MKTEYRNLEEAGVRQCMRRGAIVGRGNGAVAVNGIDIRATWAFSWRRMNVRKKDKTVMLRVDRVGDRHSWAILARNFSVENGKSAREEKTCSQGCKISVITEATNDE